MTFVENYKKKRIVKCEEVRDSIVFIFDKRN